MNHDQQTSNDDRVNDPQDARGDAFVIRTSSLMRHSSFVIRHVSYVH
jgi:hypothetical protein